MPTYPLINVVDGNGYNINGTATGAVAAGAGTTPVKAQPGHLVGVIVTGASPTGALTFYDNASTGSGTVIGVVPSGAASGAYYPFNAPAANGITAVGAAGSAAVTVIYS